jgi:predicted transcriptional regulator
MRWGLDLNILMVIATKPDITVEEISNNLGCSVISAYRRVKALESEGWLKRDGWGRKKVCKIQDEERLELLLKLHKIIYMQDALEERNGNGDVK